MSVGRVGDQWLQDLQFLRIERSIRGETYGYQVTYYVAGHGTLVLFWPRDEIDLDGSKPGRYRGKTTALKRGRLWYPTRITSRSLPSVHQGILQLEDAYAKQADGAIEAMEGFMVVAAQGDGAASASPIGETVRQDAGAKRTADGVRRGDQGRTPGPHERVASVDSVWPNRCGNKGIRAASSQADLRRVSCYPESVGIMKFVHRIGLRLSAGQREALNELGLQVPAGTMMPGDGDPLVAFDVDESHPNWRLLRAKFEEWNASDIVTTVFSKKEVNNAQWLNLVADWHHGYPQPDEDIFGYRQATYDLTNWCERCGIGMKQKAPFQMKGEPRWGKRNILQLGWVFDEYFVTPDAWASVFKPNGIDRRPVMNTKGGELKTVVQLVVRAKVGIVTEGLPTAEVACSACGRTKYSPITRGPFPALTSAPSAAMAKSKESFGSGAAADKGVLVSRALAQALTASNIRGASLRPVATLEG